MSLLLANADSFDRTIVHLNHRDVTMLCISRAPLAELSDYKRRMGWSFQWVSSLPNEFSYDLGSPQKTEYKAR